MQWFYDAGYDYGGGLPGSPEEIHGFLLRKPSAIRAHLLRDRVVAASALRRPQPVSEEELLQVHDTRVVANLKDGHAVAQAIEFPLVALLPQPLVWRAVVAPQLLAAGGTGEALHVAAQGEWAINLSGGFHHARRDLSHGFCLVNDIALGVARLRQAGISRRILVFDLDLHQGDGTATFFASDPQIYTVSIHEEGIFPFPKAHSSFDIGLPPGTEDARYLREVRRALAHVQHHFQPELIVYVAGTDPYQEDSLGSLAVTEAGLLERDQTVAQYARDLGCPLVVLPAGGYSPRSPVIAAAGFRAIAALEPRSGE